MLSKSRLRVADDQTESARSRLAKEFLFSLSHSLPEQQRIVGILDEAFDGIATAKANAEKNLQNARALFESHLQSVFTQRGEGWVETAWRCSEVPSDRCDPKKSSYQATVFLTTGKLQDPADRDLGENTKYETENST